MTLGGMELESHPEVVNREPSALIVGYGHVGREIAKHFASAHYVDIEGVIYDPAGGQALPRYDIGFICVPTPQASDGTCDTSLVKAAYRQWRLRAHAWCIKSTVSVGTTENLGADVCFSPEYYGETLYHPNAGMPSGGDLLVILGGPREVTRVFATAWSMVTHASTRIYQTDARTAELCKLAENAWLATKVTFCNQLFGVCEAAGIDYHELRELWLADPRVGRSHTYVYPNNRGFAGKCLPKDTSNLCAWAREVGAPLTMLEAARVYNAEIRALMETRQ